MNLFDLTGRVALVTGYVTGAVLPVDGGVVALPTPPGQSAAFFADTNKKPDGA